jgi:hypothetical protein
MLGLADSDDLQLKARLLERIDWLRENPEKALQHVLMFLALTLIYAAYLKGFIETARPGSQVNAIGLPAIARFIAFAGWPFAGMALLATTWTREDAARVALAAFAVSATIWLHRYGLHACAAGLSMLFLPLLFSASIGHGVGRLCQRRKSHP